MLLVARQAASAARSFSHPARGGQILEAAARLPAPRHASDFFQRQPPSAAVVAALAAAAGGPGALSRHLVGEETAEVMLRALIQAAAGSGGEDGMEQSNGEALADDLLFFESREGEFEDR